MATGLYIKYLPREYQRSTSVKPRLTQTQRAKKASVLIVSYRIASSVSCRARRVMRAECVSLQNESRIDLCMIRLRWRGRRWAAYTLAALRFFDLDLVHVPGGLLPAAEAVGAVELEDGEGEEEGVALAEAEEEAEGAGSLAELLFPEPELPPVTNAATAGPGNL